MMTKQMSIEENPPSTFDQQSHMESMNNIYRDLETAAGITDGGHTIASTMDVELQFELERLRVQTQMQEEKLKTASADIKELRELTAKNQALERDKTFLGHENKKLQKQN